MAENKYDFKEKTSEIGDVIKKRCDVFYQYILTRGILGIWRRSHLQYHAGFYSGGSIQEGGQDGEVWELSINDYRNLIQHLAILITGPDVKWDVRAINTDEKSQLQSMIVPGLLDYQEKYGGAREESYRAAEYCLVYGDGYMLPEWDESMGDRHAVVEREGKNFLGEDMMVPVTVKTGDVKYRAVAPIDVIFDVSQRDFTRNQWVIVRQFMNKWELADKFPEYRNEIEGLTHSYDPLRELDEDVRTGNDGDYIPTYTLFHKATATMPMGRKTFTVGDGIVLVDDVLGHDEIPLSRMTPAFIDRTPFGYTVGFDMLAPQRLKDILTSIIASNQTMFGVQNIMAPEGSNVSKEDLGPGMNFIKYPPGMAPPQVLNLVSTPKEIPDFVRELSASMELQSGVNSVTRGAPQGNVTAGNAMALLQQQTIQFSLQSQRAYVDMREKAAMAAIDIMRRNLKVEKAIKIIGLMPGQYIKSFLPDDLEGVSRITLDLGNPGSKTAIGKQARADNLLQYGAITDPKMYVQIAETGNLEVGTESGLVENILIRNHQEALMRMEMPVISWTDDHARFLNMAKDLANSPNVRAEPALLENIMQYIRNRIELYINTDPQRLAAIGRAPLLPPAPPPGGAPPPGAPPQGGPPKGEPEGAPAQGIPPGQSFPTNPMTKQEWNPATGG